LLSSFFEEFASHYSDDEDYSGDDDDVDIFGM